MLGPHGAPAAINVGPVDHREEQDDRLPLHLAGEVARTPSPTLALVIGTNVRMGGHLVAMVALVDRVFGEHVATEVSAKSFDKFFSW